MVGALVSVIMINHNKADFLETSINSVVNQNYQSKEIIIVDHGSTDKSTEILAEYEKKYDYVSVEYQPQDEALPALLNYAVSKTRGKYIMNIHPGDILYSDAMETLVNQSEENNLDVCNGSMIYLDEYGSPHKPRLSSGAPYEFGRLIKQQYLAQPCMYKKSIYEKAGGYDETLSIAADWDLDLRIEEISDHFGWTGSRPIYCHRKYESRNGNSGDETLPQEILNKIKSSAFERRNSQRMLIIGRKWDEQYIMALRKEGNDVVTFFEESAEKSHLEQYPWFRASYKRRFYSIFKLWRRCSRILRKFKGDLIIIKDELPFSLDLLIHYRVKDIPKKRLY